MLDRILVAYATKHGATADVAEAVAAELHALGLEVDVVEARAASDVGGYDAVVVGAPLYMGRWHRDARVFLTRSCRELARRPLAVFALGPLKEDEAMSRRRSGNWTRRWRNCRFGRRTSSSSAALSTRTGCTFRSTGCRARTSGTG